MTEPNRRENLEKLAAYLEQLPADYQHFEMSTYVDPDYNKTKTVAEYALNNGGLNTCGTAGCAIGHGPAAGILFTKEQFHWGRPSWGDYVENFVDCEFDEEYNWLFHPSWSYEDNTPHGAAARIRYFLANGIPEGFDEDLLCLEPGDEDYINLPAIYAEYLVTNK